MQYFLSKKLFDVTRPALFKSAVLDNFNTVLGFIFFLHFISNLAQIESAALTLICCPTIVRHKEKKGLFLVVKKPLLYFLIIFLNTGSLLDNIFFALYQYELEVFSLLSR